MTIHKLVAFDTETTGPDPDVDHVVSFAAIVFHYDDVTKKTSRHDGLSFKCKPPIPISDGASEIHGIKNEDVENINGIEGWRMDLEALFGADAKPVAYNGMHFDAPILNREFERVGIQARVSNVIDPLIYIREVDRYVKGKGRHKLVTTCKRHGVFVSGAHDAMADCEMLVGLVENLGVGKFIKDAWQAEQYNLNKDQTERFEAFIAQKEKEEKEKDRENVFYCVDNGRQYVFASKQEAEKYGNPFEVRRAELGEVDFAPMIVNALSAAIEAQGSDDGLVIADRPIVCDRSDLARLNDSVLCAIGDWLKTVEFNVYEPV